MTQIKSEKAQSYLNDNGYTMYGEPVICLISATKAVIIAETEAEKRHATELGALKQKAVEAFDSMIGATNFYNSNNDNFGDLKDQFVQNLMTK